ncbi:DUF4192 domain-containing protein [Streptomyces sp. NPDC005805]|uniref:DUF4192 domain-containing protein n=1 Tax=Streptomyces sp. NPDC005805 TaxID=3157068 RepID=UPI0033FD8623
MNKHYSSGPRLTGDRQITLRSPAELADALPYMMGFHPNDSIVLVTLHGGEGRFGGRLRIGIPRSPDEWEPVADQVADCLIRGSERRGAHPDGMVVFLCRDPAVGEGGDQVVERLRPLAQYLRVACGALDVPVYEALCISGGRFWSYCCPDARCCPADGTPLPLGGTSVMAAAAAYAGLQVRGTQKEMEARLVPAHTPRAMAQAIELDAVGAALVARAVEEGGRRQLAAETLALARDALERFAAEPGGGTGPGTDAEDDRLLTDREAAELIIGLQDRRTRDRAAQWMEGRDAGPALRLWRSLARRCVAVHQGYAAAPLTLAGWVSWSMGDEPSARVALGLALRADPDYVFAQLLHQACNEGLDPETLRHCLRQDQDWPAAPPGPGDSVAAEPAEPADSEPAVPRSGDGNPGPGGAGRTHAGPPDEATRPDPEAGPAPEEAADAPVLPKRGVRRARRRPRQPVRTARGTGRESASASRRATAPGGERSSGR